MALEDLKDTYYTVESIKQFKRRKRFPNNEMDKEVNEFYEEHRKHEISKYSDIEKLMKKVFEDKEYKLEYKEENNRTYAFITTNQKLNNRESSLIKNEINKDMYQVNIDDCDNG